MFDQEGKPCMWRRGPGWVVWMQGGGGSTCRPAANLAHPLVRPMGRLLSWNAIPLASFCLFAGGSPTQSICVGQQAADWRGGTKLHGLQQQCAAEHHACDVLALLEPQTFLAFTSPVW